MEIITSRKNEKIVHMKKLGADKKYRYETGKFLGDGKKLLYEAVKSGLEVEYVLCCGKLEIETFGADVFSVDQKLLDYVSPLKSPQDVLFSCRMPQREKYFSAGSVILENVQDPGNVGAVIRTANAFGLRSVMLLGDCADIYNPKTLRAAMGAVFRENIFKIDYTDVDEMKKSGISVYGAAMTEDCTALNRTDLSGSTVVIGNEGSGITDRLLEMCTGKVVIPMNPECESLNAAVAASVIMWEMSKTI